jgi:hypothetical protein
MRTLATTNNIETKENSYFSNFKNSKRVQWSTFRNYR